MQNTIVNNVITNFKSNMDKSTQAVAKALKDTAKISGQFSTSKSFSIPPGLENRWGVMAQAAEAANIPLMNVEKSFNKINMTVLKNGQIMNLATGKIVKQSDAMNRLTKANKRFNFNNLSLLFGFMALQRATKSMMRGIITTYQKANEDTQGLGKATWELQAAWEFLKYSLVDALTQSPIFKLIIQWLTDMIKKFNELSPKAKSFIMFAIVFTFIAATIGLAIIQLKMFSGAMVTNSGIGIKAILPLIGNFVLFLAIGYLLIGVFDGIGKNLSRVSGEGTPKVFGLSDAFIYLIRVLMMLKEFVAIGTDAVLTFFEVGFAGVMGFITDIQRLIKWIEILTKKWQIWIAEKTGRKTSTLEKQLRALEDEKRALDKLSDTFLEARNTIWNGFKNQETKSFKEMWDATDIFGSANTLATAVNNTTGLPNVTTSTTNTTTNTNVSIGDINVQTDAAIKDANSLADAIWEILNNRLDESITKKIDSVNN